MPVVVDDEALIISEKRKRKQVNRLNPSEQSQKDQKKKVKIKAPVCKNALDKPFYVETYSASNIDLCELKEIRSMWELPALAQMLWMLQKPLRLKIPNSLSCFEIAILDPVSSTLLDDIFTKLLLDDDERKRVNASFGLPYKWWNQRLHDFYDCLYQKWHKINSKSNRNEDEWRMSQYARGQIGESNPLADTTFAFLPVALRVRLLYNLTEMMVERHRNVLRDMENDDIRVEPLAFDRKGGAYFYFPQFYQDGRRLYRLANGSWNLWAAGVSSFKSMLSALESSSKSHLGEEDVLQEYLKSFIEECNTENAHKAQVDERNKKKELLNTLPRKRSARLQVKQLAEFEEDTSKIP